MTISKVTLPRVPYGRLSAPQAAYCTNKRIVEKTNAAQIEH